MVAKRKTLSSIAKTASRQAAVNKPEVLEADAEDLGAQLVEAQLVAVEEPGKIMKKPAVASNKKDMSKHDEDQEDDMEVEEEEEEEVSEEEKIKRREKEIMTERTKELKLMYMDDLKELVTAAGLTTGKKEDMIKTLLKHETKARAVAREQEAKIRTVVVEKKKELESQSIALLGKQCESLGIKGTKTKSERIERLLVTWQEQDGVDKALAKKALEERWEELMDMDNSLLRKMCEKAGMDPFVKEVLVDRVSKREHEMGRYSRAASKKEEAPQEKKLDMVEALLANESARKKEKDLKAKQEEEIAKKKKELRSMAVEELKKTMEKKGLEVPLKKEEMIETLFEAGVEEEKVVSRKAELKKMSLAKLKEFAVDNGLEAGSMSSMVEAVLAFEATRRQELRTFEAKASEVTAQRKEHFEKKSLSALKDLCSSKGLGVAGGKEDKVERLLEEAQRSGEIDNTVSIFMRNARKDTLALMEKTDLLKLCDRMNIDPFVKSVMVERILSKEEECAEPLAKKQRRA